MVVARLAIVSLRLLFEILKGTPPENFVAAIFRAGHRLAFLFAFAACVARMRFLGACERLKASLARIFVPPQFYMHAQIGAFSIALFAAKSAWRAEEQRPAIAYAPRFA